MLVRLFGQQAPGVVRDAAAQPGELRVLSPEPGLCAALSGLARLDAAQATSPVPRSSPWWAAEAAELDVVAEVERLERTKCGCPACSICSIPASSPKGSSGPGCRHIPICSSGTKAGRAAS